MKLRIPLRHIIFCIIIWIFLVLSYTVSVSAGTIESQEKEQEKWNDFLDLKEEYAAIQEVVDSLSEGSSFSFSSYVTSLIKGDTSFSFHTLLQYFFNGIQSEAAEGKRNISFLLAVGIVGGMLSGLSNIFLNRQAANIGFYMLYLLLFSVFSATFMELTALAERVFFILLQFMKVLLPAYFLAIAFCTGARTSFVFYETMMVIITVVEIFVMKIILPAIRVYFVFGMVHHLTEKPFLTRLLAMLEKLIRGSVKVIFLVILSIQGIEGMLAPFADAAAKSMVLKAVGAIPGLGTGVAGMAEAILKSGMLLKNAIGLAGIFGIIFLCAYPIGKMVFYTGLYYFGSAATEAVAEPRILACMTSSAHAAGLLLYTACAGILLFLLTIGITLATTNV